MESPGSRVVNVRYMHNRVFSPTLFNIKLKSDCLSHIVNISRNAGRGGATTW